MRVALLVPSIFRGKGGAEKVASQVANIVQRHGGSSTVLGTPAESCKPSYPLDEGVDLLPVHMRDYATFSKLVGDFDLLVGFAMDKMFAGIPAIARHIGVPFAIQECTNPARMVSLLHTRRQDGCRTLRDAFWLRQAVFAHASALRFTVPDYVHSVVPQLRPFSYAFYNSLSAGRFERSPERGCSKRVICVGSMKNRNKNGLTGVRAFAEFSRTHADWSLHLYGKNAFTGELAAIQAQYPHAKIVDHGIVDGLDRIYGEADLLVIPSYEEGLPNVVVEAFSFGIPCIGYSDCAGVNHLIEDGVTGRLVDRSHPGGLSQALSEFANDRNFLERTADLCVEFARRSFEMPVFERNWLTLLENAVRGANNRGEPQPVPAAADERFGRASKRILKSLPRYVD